MTFCTAVNCMDGRVQLPVIHYLKEHCGVLYVDLVTEPGPAGLLTEPGNSIAKESILQRVALSRDAHGSQLLAVVAHADCAGNPAGKEKQRRQLEGSVEYLAMHFPGMSVLGLWVDADYSIKLVCRLGPTHEADRRSV